MKRFVGLFTLLLLLLSIQTMKAYELTINATSDVEEINDGYNARLWNLDTYQYTPISGSVLQPTTFQLIPGNYVIYGYSFNPDSHQAAGHFFYGQADELTIITLTEENPAQTIDIHIEAGNYPQHFITYDIIDIYGHDVIPIFQDFVFNVFTKQLVYENDDNNIMLIGYQLYTPNGWETTLFEEEYLYLDNDAQPGDTFYSFNYLFWEGGGFLSRSIMNVLGSHEIDMEGNTFTTTAVEMYFTSMMEVWYTYWYEFTGNEAPLLRSLRSTGSGSTIYDLSYDNEYDSSKLLNLTPNIEVTYHRIVEEDNAPKNLVNFNNDFYWYPPSSYELSGNSNWGNQIFYWQHDFNNETLIDSLIISAYSEHFHFDQANLLHTNYSFWVRRILDDGTLTESTNVVSWPTNVNNENHDIANLLQLQDNYPNPFNPETTISFNIPTSGKVSLEIFNLRGQKVKTLVNGHKDAGQHTLVWNGKDDDNKRVASGVYLYKIKSKTFTSCKKMILMK